MRFTASVAYSSPCALSRERSRERRSSGVGVERRRSPVLNSLSARTSGRSTASRASTISTNAPPALAHDAARARPRSAARAGEHRGRGPRLGGARPAAARRSAAAHLRDVAVDHAARRPRKSGIASSARRSAWPVPSCGIWRTAIASGQCSRQPAPRRARRAWPVTTTTASGASSAARHAARARAAATPRHSSEHLRRRLVAERQPRALARGEHGDGEGRTASRRGAAGLRHRSRLLLAVPAGRTG